jgi:hypothetical protein
MIKLFELYIEKKNKTLYIPYQISAFDINSISVNDQGNTWTSSFSIKYSSQHLEKFNGPITDLSRTHVFEELKHIIEKKQISAQRDPRLIKLIFSL